MRLREQTGAVLVPLIIALSLMAALASGIYSLTSSASSSGLLAGNNNNAYELARTGIRYAYEACGASGGETCPAKTFFMPDADHTFTISINNGVLTSTGVVKTALSLEARRVIEIAVSSLWGSPSAAGGGGEGGAGGGAGEGAAAPLPSSIISFQNDMSTFGTPLSNNSNAIQTDQSGKSITLGGGVTDASGALWYQGNSTVGDCNKGACAFNLGINVYFEFTFITEDSSQRSDFSADGFTFAVISAVNNTRDRTGGAPEGYSMGELLGYAGPGNTTDKHGLKPPKMALEFDVYPNINRDVCYAGSRNDANAGYPSFRNHISLMFWGARSVPGTCYGYNKSSFDDNAHGAGSGEPGSDPMNSPDETGAGYYESSDRGYTCKSSANTCNWLEDGHKYSARIEIARSNSPASGGTYPYRFKAWILSQSANCTGACYTTSLDEAQQDRFQDVMVPLSYTGPTDPAPQIDRTVFLSERDHNEMSNIFFGFTEATGGGTQQITIENLRTFFPTGDCSYSATSSGQSSSNAAYEAPGGTGSINVTTATTCPWIASTKASWIHITSGNSGAGNGLVSYTVDINTGPERTGYINIAGQIFTVIQRTCLYDLSSDNNQGSPLGAATNLSGSLNLTTESICPWTASNNGNSWITVAPATGTGSGMITYTATANTGSARSATITIGGRNFQVYQSGGCTYSLNPYSVSRAAGASTGNTVSVAAGSGCAWTAVSNNSWLTITGGGSGSGSGTVTYSMAVNTGTAARSGTLTIAGQTFTVSQSGACAGYRVWNNYGNNTPFAVSGGTCRSGLTLGSEITNTSTQIILNGSVTRYNSWGCNSARGSISYINAINADVNGNCQINYNSQDTAGDR